MEGLGEGWWKVLDALLSGLCWCVGTCFVTRLVGRRGGGRGRGVGRRSGGRKVGPCI